MLRRPRHAEPDHPQPAEPATAATGATAEPESGTLAHNGLLVDHSTRTAQLRGRDWN